MGVSFLLNMVFDFRSMNLLGFAAVKGYEHCALNLDWCETTPAPPEVPELKFLVCTVGNYDYICRSSSLQIYGH